MTTGDEGKIKMVKGMVFVMTLVFIVGLVMLVYGIVNGRKEKHVSDSIAVPEASSVVGNNGLSVKGMVSCAEFLCVHIAGPLGDKIAIVEPKSGKIRNMLDFLE